MSSLRMLQLVTGGPGGYKPVKPVTETEKLLAERDRLIERNIHKPAKRNETRIWNINLRLAELQGQ